MNREVAALRAHRAEVDAWLAWRAACQRSEPEALVLAWWRLTLTRRHRTALLAAKEAARLSPLPAPPPGALGRLQALRLRLGWLDRGKLAPPARVARALSPELPTG
jgi:hypothetical protein